MSYTEDGYYSARLSRFAKPETVIVEHHGERITPVRFNQWGFPQFSKQQVEHIGYKDTYVLKIFDNLSKGKVKVQYEEMPFDAQRSEYDSEEALNAISDMDELNRILDMRRRHCFIHGRDLKEFVLFGYLLLNEDGNVNACDIPDDDKIKKVEDKKSFLKRNRPIVFTPGRFTIPPAGERCPYCMKKFELNDIMHMPCVKKEKDYYHGECYKSYRAESTIRETWFRFISQLYGLNEVEIKLEDNPLNHNDWEDARKGIKVLFKTIHGDITVLRLKSSTILTFGENYELNDKVMRELGIDPIVRKLHFEDGEESREKMMKLRYHH